MYKILTPGIVSESRMLVENRVLTRTYDKALTLNFFFVYSNFEIPVGSPFTQLYNAKTQTLIKINACLIDVTQGWGFSLNSIPNGYKTIARITFDNEEHISILKKDMPIISTWQYSDKYFELIE